MNWKKRYVESNNYKEKTKYKIALTKMINNRESNLASLVGGSRIH